MRSNQILLSGGLAGVLILSMLALSACNLSAGTSAPTQPSPDVYYTEAAKTIEAGLIDNLHNLLQQPRLRRADERPPLHHQPPAVATSSAPMISSASQLRSDQHCLRPPVSAGARADIGVRGVDTGFWWYIANPGKAGQFCWIGARPQRWA
jgi:hypothetical protein